MSSNLEDEHLRRLLRRGWTAAAEPSSGFRAAVWARIDTAQRLPATWAGWLRLHVPGVAFAAAVGIFAAGAGGSLLARHQAAQAREAQIRHYVASIDPHQQLSSAPSP
ncbi:MAG: hypothetical protein HS122_14495 [Opitutaceae bacterium]|nr:hypothetical protein [Opitutaceae bacterium]